MAMTQKDVLHNALKLPRKVRVKLAEQLIESLEDAELGEVLAQGAREAHGRIKACRTGKMKTVSEEEIQAILETKKLS